MGIKELLNGLFKIFNIDSVFGSAESDTRKSIFGGDIGAFLGFTKKAVKHMNSEPSNQVGALVESAETGIEEAITSGMQALKKLAADFAGIKLEDAKPDGKAPPTPAGTQQAPAAKAEAAQK